jgi:hypothetical protein
VSVDCSAIIVVCVVPARRAEALLCSGPRQDLASECRIRRRQLSSSFFAQAWHPAAWDTKVRGTEIVRPSFRDTLREVSVNETSATFSSAPSAKIPMPSLQKLLLMFHYDAIQYA